MSSGFFRELMRIMTTQRPESMLTFENQQIKGRDDIIEKLSVWPLGLILNRSILGCESLKQVSDRLSHLKELLIDS